MSVVEKSIGELLVDNGQISAEELRLAEREARSTGEPLSVILSKLGLAYEHHFKNALELKYGVTYVSLARTEVQPEVLKKVPEAKLREHMMVPVHEKGNRVTVVMVNPEHTTGLTLLKEYFAERQFTPVVCTEDDFTLFMSNLYRGHIEANPAAKESNGAKEEISVEPKAAEPAAARAQEKPPEVAPAVKAAEAPPAPAEKPLSPLAAFLAKGKEMQNQEAEAAAAAPPEKTEIEPPAKAEVEPPAKVEPEIPAKAEIELPTNDETGKFDLNMLQKHIEQTRSKTGKKPADERAAEQSKSTTEISKPAPIDDKPTEITAEPVTIAEIKPEPEPEAKVEQPSQPETKPEPEPVAEVKPEAKKERPDARDVARQLAKELAEEAKDQPGSGGDDEATGEFDALSSSTMEKKQSASESEPKPEAKEEPPQEVELSPEKPETPKEPDAQEKTSAIPMDQTGEDFKAVSPKSKGEAALGECEPVASESVARPADKKGPDALEKEGDDAAVIMLCNQILANGIAKGASTVHVEVVDKQVLVHYRIQGQLMIVRKLPKMLMPALTARFRKMARVDTLDRRLPQDGRVKVRMSGKDFDLRMTVVPHTAGGEHILVWIE